MAFVERVAVRKRGGQVKNTWKQGLVGAPEVGVAVDRGAPEMGAMITLLQREELYAVGLPTYFPVLTRDAQGRFNGIRAAGSEEDAARTLGFEDFH
jgi:hypothetical protein